MKKRIDLIVPTTLFDIPLKHYQEFIKTFQGQDEKNYTNEYAACKMLEIFCGLKKAETLNIKITDLNKIVGKLNKALSEKPSLITRFKLGDTEFGFVPKLDELTFGEFVDLESYINDWSTMHKAMAILYRPVVRSLGSKYEIEEYKGDIWDDIMLDMPSAVAVSSLVFFYRLESDLLRVTLNSSEVVQEGMIETLRQAETFIKTGGGITQ